MPGINSQDNLAYYETLGEQGRGDEVILSRTAKALIGMADFLITTARENMDKDGTQASGETDASMNARDIQINGTKMELDIEINSTYKFLNDGVKGVGGKGKGKYQFRTVRPSKKHVDAIRKWLRIRGIRAGYAKKYGAYGKVEKKDKTMSPEAMAYAVATGIKKKGIKPTKFFTKAVEETEKRQVEFLAEAFKLDIIESIN